MNWDILYRELSGCFYLTVVTACTAYTYATITRTNTWLAVKVSVVTMPLFFLIRECVEYGIGTDEARKNRLYIVSTTVGGAALISALNNYEFISTLSTLILGTAHFVLNAAATLCHTQKIYIYANFYED